MSEEEFWLTVKRTEEPSVPFDVVYIVSRRGGEEESRGKLCYPALFFIPSSNLGFSISVTTLISTNVHISAL